MVAPQVIWEGKGLAMPSEFHSVILIRMEFVTATLLPLFMNKPATIYVLSRFSTGDAGANLFSSLQDLFRAQL